MGLSYVARQPILDRNKKLYGYELLFRNSEKNAFPSVTDEEATHKLVIEQFFEHDQSVLGGKLGFINFPYNSLIQKLPTVLPNEHVIIEILEDCEPTMDLLSAVIALKKEGYRFALDDFVPSPEWKPFLPYIDIIKFDIQILPLDKLERLMRKMAETNIKFLAEKIETYDEFKQALDMGFEYFQGYFFSKPELIKRKK
ncbi:EAL domain-containing protein [Vibrio sp. kj40-1]|uniref:EAL domain-containing protein n=1 Tax=Vibrio algarum TaxID=3020714 RepID=A0ABT4YMM5_9VIBR|nr:EAL domain-containing protein [Vibrio sp. KJ40-1]MDB1122695.1 EAL domain-containing protein [Vibrio sp. KJ40-1]